MTQNTVKIFRWRFDPQLQDTIADVASIIRQELTDLEIDADVWEHKNNYLVGFYNEQDMNLWRLMTKAKLFTNTKFSDLAGTMYYDQ